MCFVHFFLEAFITIYCKFLNIFVALHATTSCCVAIWWMCSLINPDPGSNLLEVGLKISGKTFACSWKILEASKVCIINKGDKNAVRLCLCLCFFAFYFYGIPRGVRRETFVGGKYFLRLESDPKCLELWPELSWLWRFPHRMPFVSVLSEKVKGQIGLWTFVKPAVRSFSQSVKWCETSRVNFLYTKPNKTP